MINIDHLSQLHKNLLSAMSEEDSHSSLRDKMNAVFRGKFKDIGIIEKERLKEEITGFGPLKLLLQDTSITEIIVNAHNAIWIERSGKLEQLKDQFISHESYLGFLSRLFDETKMKPDLDRPFADGVWQNFRVHVILPPLTTYSPTLTLRRQCGNQWNLNRLENIEWASSKAIEILKSFVQRKSNILIIGPTNTGKTSVLNALLEEVSSSERIVSIEDSDEVSLPNKASTKLLSRVHASDVLKDYDMGDLLKQSLRMRPDRLVVGEVRGPEAKDLLMAFATGHDGGMTTLHASSARQALIRLEMLIQLGAPQWSLQAVRHLIALSIHHIVVLKKENGKRQLDSIYRLASVEETGFCLERCY